MMRAYTLAAVLMACPVWLPAAEFLGAEAILKKAQDQSQQAKPQAKKDPVETLREKVKAYQSEAAKLPAEEAAAQWLVLFDTLMLIPQELMYQSGYGERLSFGNLIEALPPSMAWDALATAIEKRPKETHPLRQQSLVLISTVLRDDSAARKQALAGMRDLITQQKKIDSHTREYLEQMVERVSQALDTLAGDTREQLAAFAKTLSELEKPDKNRYSRHLEIPDLLRDADEKEVAPLIKRALKLDLEINVHGKQTRRLAAKLAFEHLKDLKKPVWSLIETEDDLPLYEALAKKFPKENNDWSRNRADQVHLLHLIAADRTKDATQFTLDLISASDDRHLSIGAHEVEAMQKQGFGRQMLSFLKQMLVQEPSLPLWKAYIELSAHEGESKEALQQLREAVAKPTLKGKARSEVEAHLFAALLAANEVDEGLSILRALVQKGPQTAEGDSGTEAAKEQWAKLGVKLPEEALRTLANRHEESPESTQIDRAEFLAKVGHLLGKPEVVEEALNAAVAAYQKLPPQNSSRSSELEDVVKLLVTHGRSPQAESMLADELVIEAQSDPKNDRYNSGQGKNLMSQLMWIYHQAGRSADIVHLLDHSPYWQAKDLASFQQESSEEPVLLMVAKALADTGKKDEARRIVQRAIQSWPGKDSIYALMLSLGGDDLESRLDALHAANRFEERPLIWKAQLQLDQGRVDEAEKTIRAAIAIDPSDGEQGKGDRMRAYSVLAAILEKKGDADQAKVMRGAVKAIRISEDADDWWNAGLLSRAVAMYEEALLHFADAYCIQSRLALRYSELGDFAKAEIHYQRAFELMPESFGRVESHCFGCEGAFRSKRAQNIAEKVFTQLAEKMPDKAQVFYLLGYLREQQRNYPEAAEHYRKAVKLDPDYLNAWKKLQGLGQQVRQPKAEREQIALTLFRLNPEGRGELRSLTNLRLLWDTVLAAEATQTVPETGPLYPLTASAATLEKDSDSQRNVDMLRNLVSEGSNYREQLSQHPLIQITGQLVETVSQRGY